MKYLVFFLTSMYLVLFSVLYFRSVWSYLRHEFIKIFGIKLRYTRFMDTYIL